MSAGKKRTCFPNNVFATSSSSRATSPPPIATMRLLLSTIASEVGDRRLVPLRYPPKLDPLHRRHSSQMARKRRWLVLPERYDSGRHKAHVSGDPVNTADTFRRGTDVDNGSFGIKLPKDLFGVEDCCKAGFCLGNPLVVEDSV